MKLKIYCLLFINILLMGNIYSLTRDRAEAAANYQKAIESKDENKIKSAGNKLKKIPSAMPIEIVNNTESIIKVRLSGPEQQNKNVTAIFDTYEIPAGKSRVYALHWGMMGTYNKVTVTKSDMDSGVSVDVSKGNIYTITESDAKLNISKTGSFETGSF